jgi:hypothetical protein
MNPIGPCFLIAFDKAVSPDEKNRRHNGTFTASGLGFQVDVGRRIVRLEV